MRRCWDLWMRRQKGVLPVFQVDKAFYQKEEMAKMTNDSLYSLRRRCPSGLIKPTSYSYINITVELFLQRTRSAIYFCTREVEQLHLTYLRIVILIEIKESPISVLRSRVHRFSSHSTQVLCVSEHRGVQVQRYNVHGETLRLLHFILSSVEFG